MVSRLDIRQRIEGKEEELSPYAVKSRLSQGRLKYEEPSPVRTEFQRDRDRIIHSKAFRRLKHKTQVFIAPLGDHYVTRLTHTLEVSQIARTIARALNLNEDLTEAIALGHDLGHTPFGHVGEDVLNELYHEGFRHNEQSLRVVDLLEKDGQGLNLTWEVRDGILTGGQGPDDAPGDLLSKESFDDFELCVTFRMVWPANSGVWYRYQSPEKTFQADILEYKKPFALTGTLYCPGKMFIATNTDASIIHR